MGKIDGVKIKLPRKLCILAQFFGHALKPRIRIYTISGILRFDWVPFSSFDTEAVSKYNPMIE